jgi:hypothetical protein
MRDASAARMLTVVLATAGLSACSGTVNVHGSGGSGGSTTTTGTAGDAGVYDAPGDGLVSDAVPEPLVCSTVDAGQGIAPAAELMGSTLTLTLDWSPYPQGALGWNGVPSVVAEQALGTVAGVSVQGLKLIVTIALTAPTAGGDVTLTGDLRGFGGPPSYGQVDCMVSRIFKVVLVDGGPPMVSELSPGLGPPGLPVDQRPRLSLRLVGAEGVRADIRAEGVPEGALVELETTGGVAHREGERIDWALPPEPGLYQIEVVVRRGSAIATSALALEVKEAG